MAVRSVPLPRLVARDELSRLAEQERLGRLGALFKGIAAVPAGTPGAIGNDLCAELCALGVDLAQEWHDAAGFEASATT